MTDSIDRFSLVAPLLASIAALMMLPAAQARADSIYVDAGRHRQYPIPDILITAIRWTGNTELLVYTSESGGEGSRPLEKVVQIDVPNEPTFNRAEAESAKGDLQAASGDYRKVINTATKDWMKQRAAVRLIGLLEESDDFLSLIRGFVELAPIDPEFAARHRPAVPVGTPKTKLDQAIAIVNAGLPNTSRKIRLIYDELLLKLYLANGNMDKAIVVSKELEDLSPKLSNAAVLPLPRNPLSAKVEEINAWFTENVARGAEEWMKAEGAVGRGEKVRIARASAAVVDEIIRGTDDPMVLAELARAIVEFGVAPDVNSLEYWGEDPATQARLKPVAGAAVKLFGAVATLAKTKADEVEDRIDTEGNTVLGTRWEELDNLARSAEFAGITSIYFECLATPRETGAPHSNGETAGRSRADMAHAALQRLREFDNPASGIQARVRIVTGKLFIVAGECAKAREVFRDLCEERPDISPLPSMYEQYEAYYFWVVADLLGADLSAAIDRKRFLDAWQLARMGALFDRALVDKKAQKCAQAITAAGQLLQWRILQLQRDLARDATAKKPASDAAGKVLLELKSARPDLAERIDQQLGGHLPADAIGRVGMPEILTAGQGASEPGAGMLGPNCPLFHHSANARRIVFVCDASGSMINKMPMLKDQLGKAVSGLKPSQSFDVIFFQNEQSESFARFEHKEALVGATLTAKRAFSRANGFLERMSAAGTTDPVPALEAAFASHPALIYFLTDGDFPDNDAVLKKIAELKRDLPCVKINTIAFIGDGDNDTAFLVLLKKIADDSGGNFQKAKESDIEK